MNQPPGFAGPGGAVIQLWPGSTEALLEAAAGVTPVWWLRGSRMRTRSALMDEWAAAAQFPPHFGGNWDALRDALSDLPRGGTFLVLEADQLLQEAQAADSKTLFAVLHDLQDDLTPRPFRIVFQVDPARQEAILRRFPELGTA